MARRFPEEFPVDLKADRAGSAEYQVYEALADELDDDWLVIHRVRWQDRPERGRPHDGETDFVIAHPGRGMLTLEVKGGEVACDPKTGRWTSRDQQGEVHDIRDPFEQSQSSFYALRRKILSVPAWRGREVPMGHAVALPGCSKTAFPGPAATPEITLDAADLARPLESVERAFGFWRLRPSEDWRHHGLALLERLFVHRDFARVPLGVRVGQHEREFVRLTQEQIRLLDHLRLHRRAAIAGCAGSGKTMLAVEKARRLSSEGFNVLVTCFNRALAEFIRHQLPAAVPVGRAAGPRAGRGRDQIDLFGGTRVDVESFHALAASWARRAGVALPDRGEGAETERFFDSALPEALMKALDRLPERYDAVIVDEGQDFHADWWVPLQSLLQDPDHGILYVFYDDNQSLYTTGAALPIAGEPHLLTTNCRNTRPIHEWVTRYYRGAVTPEAGGPAGPPPEVLAYRDDRELREHLRRVLHRLVHDERVPERDIVVLSPYGKRVSALWREPRYGNLALTDAWPPAPGYVQCETVHAFKGLERAVVVLAEVGDDARMKAAEVCYVGGSRAKSHLVVIAREGAGGVAAPAGAQR
jgi:hypothetical protein